MGGEGASRGGRRGRGADMPPKMGTFRVWRRVGDGGVMRGGVPGVGDGGVRGWEPGGGCRRIAFSIAFSIAFNIAFSITFSIAFSIAFMGMGARRWLPTCTGPEIAP